MSTGHAVQATATGTRPAAPPAPARSRSSAGLSGSRVRGWLPAQGAVVTLLAALGLVLCAYCEDRSRATLAPNPWIYWAGVILIVAPIVYRLTAFSMSSRERVSLVVIEGLALYVARMLRDPYGFTLTDEFMHAFNINNIIATHHLYHANPLLAVSAHFPGLEAATSAIASLTGMAGWGSGLVIVGAARVMIMLALYSLFTAISSSARVGALGAALFAANSQFIIFEGQYAYESLALPLLIVLLAALAERQRAKMGSSSSTAWSLITVVTIIAIVPTHHLTAYVMVVCLWLLVIFQGWIPFGPLRKRLQLVAGPPIWPFALMGTILTLAWLLVVASQTVGYLSPEIGGAFVSTFKTLSGDGHARALFSNSGASAGSVNLKSEEAVSFLEPVMLVLAAPFGIITLWRKKRWTPFIGLCCVMAGAYIVLSLMRVVPSAWEVGNRGAEFAFFGFTYLVGVTTLGFSKRFWRFRTARVFVGLAIGLCVVGGAVAGWPANTRLSLPTEIKTPDGATLYSESEQVAHWFATQPKGKVLAGDANALLIGDASGDPAYFDFTDNADLILNTPGLAANQLPALRKDHIRYVVVDLRRRSQDATTGIFFSLAPPVAPLDADYKASILTEWESLAARVYSSGSISVFDLDRKP